MSDGEVIELTQLLVSASSHATAAAAVSIIHLSAVCVRLLQALSDDALATKIADLTINQPGLLRPHVRTLNAFQDSKWAFGV
jgi:hypothetical protein